MIFIAIFEYIAEAKMMTKVKTIVGAYDAIKATDDLLSESVIIWVVLRAYVLFMESVWLTESLITVKFD